MNRKQGLVLLAVGLALLAFYSFDLQRFLSLDYFQDLYQNSPAATLLSFFLIYVLSTALSLPGAALLTLMAGALFGTFNGVILVSFASTIGATLAFLISRSLLQDWVQHKFAAQLEKINQGIAEEGAFYLFTLRLIPLVPFFVINLVMGLTRMPSLRFFWVSQVGMLAGTIVFVNAGAQLGQVEELSFSGILTPGIIFSFALLAAFPWMARAALSRYKSLEVYKGFSRPATYDTNMLVIGGGSAGLVSAYIAAAVKADVTLVEKHKMGGDCLNTGCVPSKALIRSARMQHYSGRAAEYGLEGPAHKVNFAKVMERVQGAIAQVEPHDSVERYSELGVRCVSAKAKIQDPFRVEVAGNTITTRNIVIATGARPTVPPIEGIEDIGYYSSDTIWELREQPKRMLVLGTGPIGCELAQAFSRLGSEVTLVGRNKRILPKEDSEVSVLLNERFRKEGLKVLSGVTTLACGCDDEGKWMDIEQQGTQQRLYFDVLLLAIGRTANTKGFGAENLKLATNANGTFVVNEYLQTRFENVYACGDVAGPFQFTHTAAHQAWYVAVNALFGGFKKFKVDYSVIPWATFIDPEVARVGINEQEARAQQIPYEVSRFDIEELDRAIADGENHGFIKVLTVPGKDKILGVTIVGYHSGELIAEYVSAMKNNLGLNKILGTIHIYPTLSESNKYVAGVWKKAHAPQKVLLWLAKYHRWMRTKSLRR